MNIEQLTQRLEEEGCNPGNYCIGKPWQVTDIFCLTQIDGVWQIYFTERGKHEPPIFTSPDEAAACDYYFELMMGIRHDHLVGYFREETAVHALQTLLNQHNIPSHTDKVPYGGWADPRYRVFVTGKDIFAASSLLGDVPLRD